MRRLAAVLLAVILLAGCGEQRRHPRAAATATVSATATPTPTPTPTPRPQPVRREGAAALARDLTATRRRLHAAIDAWRHAGTRSGEAPAAVRAPARRQQAIYARLATRPRLAARTLARLRGGVRAEARDVVAAQAALHVLNAPQRTPEARSQVRLGPAEPAARLLAHYREGQRRSGVPWTLLAAVNLVESDFGRLRNDSIAAAQGPMQFIASTWATYGRGGDVHDPRDAILGAARFLAAGGAAASPSRALYAYNPSPLYVTAVSRYARRMAEDPRAFYAFYAWRPPVPRRLTR